MENDKKKKRLTPLESDFLSLARSSLSGNRVETVFLLRKVESHKELCGALNSEDDVGSIDRLVAQVISQGTRWPAC